MLMTFVGGDVFRGERYGCWLAAEHCEQVEGVEYDRRKLLECVEKTEGLSTFSWWWPNPSGTIPPQRSPREWTSCRQDGRMTAEFVSVENIFA